MATVLSSLKPQHSHNNMIGFSEDTYINLKKWAKLHDQPIEEAADIIIEKFLKHQKFYEKPRDFNFYLSRPKLNIYRLLRIGGLNLTQISTRISLRYLSTRVHMEDLKEAGIVTETAYGRSPIRFFRLNMESPLTKQILKAMDTWFEPESK